MSSVYIKEESGERLHLSFEPTPVTWALAVGAMSFIIGYPLYSYDCICLILVIWVLGTAGLLAFFSPWQEVILDKEKRTLVVDRQNFYQRYNFKTSTPANYELENILAVNYDSPNIIITLVNYHTIDLNVKGDSDQVSELVNKIQKFLQLDMKSTQVDTPISEAGSLHSEATNEDSSSATSDDSFERIDTADLAEYESSKNEPDNDIPLETIETLSPSPDEPKAFVTEAEEQPTTTTESTEEVVDDPKPKAAVDSAAVAAVAAAATPTDV